MTKLHQVPEHLSAYCERAGDPGVLAEPLNFITNAAFMVAAVLLWRMAVPLRAQPLRGVADIWGLVVALFAIGIGSALWHSYAALGWTVIADVIPIYIFINLYLFSLFRRIFGLRWAQVGGLWLGFTIINITAQNTLPADTLNGSLMYVPTFGLMAGSALWLKLRADARAREFAIITALFFVSLALRTADTMLCDMIPTGTHFLWHLCNAVVLFRLVRLLMGTLKAA